MKKSILVFLLLIFANRAYCNNLIDSIGIENINGKSFILHKVRNSETLYSLLQKYNCSDDEVFMANPTLANTTNIYVNQVLKFPKASPQSIKARKAMGPTKVQHTVRKGETLYAISKRYDVPLAQLRSWNQLKDNFIHEGQSIWVKEVRSSVFSSGEEVKFDPNTKNHLPPESERVNNFVVPNAPLGRRFEERGIAQVISTENRTFKHLALHKTAPIGTLLMVTNEANNAHVMVKVVGELPETGATSNVVVRLSPSAYQKLKPRDQRLRAKIAYTLPPGSSK